jgi:carbonic anhydrase
VHAPSEHTIGGRSYDFELHIVHIHFDEESATEKLGVVGVMFDRELGGNQENAFIESLRAEEIRLNNLTIVKDVPLLKLTQSLKLDKIYNYKGSLTTPPCGEAVEWLVIDDPQPISDRQLLEF